MSVTFKKREVKFKLQFEVFVINFYLNIILSISSLNIGRGCKMQIYFFYTKFKLI